MKDFICQNCGHEFKNLNICPECYSVRIKRIWGINFKVKGYNYQNGYSISK